MRFDEEAADDIELFFSFVTEVYALIFELISALIFENGKHNLNFPTLKNLFSNSSLNAFLT
jgi:hypothetical protein